MGLWVCVGRLHVYIRIFMCIHVYLYAFTRIYKYLCVFICIYGIYVHLIFCVFLSIHADLYVCYLYVCLSMFLYSYVSIFLTRPGFEYPFPNLKVIVECENENMGIYVP